MTVVPGMDRDCLRIEFIDPGMGSGVLGVVSRMEYMLSSKWTDAALE